MVSVNNRFEIQMINLKLKIPLDYMYEMGACHIRSK